MRPRRGLAYGHLGLTLLAYALWQTPGVVLALEGEPSRRNHLPALETLVQLIHVASAGLLLIWASVAMLVVVLIDLAWRRRTTGLA